MVKCLVTDATGVVAPRVVQALCDAGHHVRTLSLDRPMAEEARDGERTLRTVPDYSVPNVSEKVARIILSVNRFVWRKTP